MKIGVILIFNNNEKDIDVKLFCKLLKSAKKTPLCFVNNGSIDNTLEVLKTVNEEAESDTIIVDVKKYKKNDVAVKAGARYLFNKCDLKQVGYLNMCSVNYDYFSEIFKTFTENKESVKDYNTLRSEKNQLHRRWEKNLFSIFDFLAFLNKNSLFYNTIPSLNNQSTNQKYS